MSSCAGANDPVAAKRMVLVTGHYDTRDPRKSLEQFRVLREADLALLSAGGAASLSPFLPIGPFCASGPAAFGR